MTLDWCPGTEWHWVQSWKFGASYGCLSIRGSAEPCGSWHDTQPPSWVEKSSVAGCSCTNGPASSPWQLVHTLVPSRLSERRVSSSVAWHWVQLTAPSRTGWV